MICWDPLSFAKGLFWKVWNSWCVCPSASECFTCLSAVVLPRRSRPQMVTQLTNSDTANSENSEANSEANSSDATEDTLGILWPWNLPLASQGLGRQLRTLMALATPATQVCFQIYKRTCCDRMIVHCEVDDLCRFLHFEHQFYLQLCKASWPAETGLTWKSLDTQSYQLNGCGKQ